MEAVIGKAALDWARYIAALGAIFTGRDDRSKLVLGRRVTCCSLPLLKLGRSTGRRHGIADRASDKTKHYGECEPSHLTISRLFATDFYP
jgi:hypothetical protein